MVECCIQYHKVWYRNKGKLKILSVIRLGFRNTDKGNNCDNQPMLIMFNVRANYKRLKFHHFGMNSLFSLRIHIFFNF